MRNRTGRGEPGLLSAFRVWFRMDGVVNELAGKP